MTDRIYDRNALAALVPHRGVNLIPDQVVLHAGGTVATATVRIPAGDPRAIFTRASAIGTAWQEPFLVEFFAVTGVALLRERLGDNEGVFSAVSRVRFRAPVPSDAALTGRAEITRDRGGFYVFACRAEIAGTVVGEAEIMAGSARLADVLTAPLRPFATLPAGAPVDARLFAGRPPRMRFLDTITAADPATGAYAGATTYPVDHPFVPGHFPTAAVMMGMSQWTALIDLAWVGMRRQGLDRALCQGVLKRADGGEVIAVRDLELVADGGLPRVASTSRVGSMTAHSLVFSSPTMYE